MKVAKVRIKWKRSVSNDIEKRVITIDKGGEVTELELGVEVSEYVFDIEANTTTHVTTTLTDAEGNVVTSDLYSFPIGDLEFPQPDTEFSHEILEVRDV